MNENEHDGGDELTSTEIENLRREHGDDVIDRELAQRGRDQEFKPRGSAPQRHDTGDYSNLSPEQADAERRRLMADEQFQKDLRSPYSKVKEPALDKLETLAKIASGGSEAPVEPIIDEMASQSPGNFKFDHPLGRSLGDEARSELQAVSHELHELGASPEIARAIWDQQSIQFFQAVRDDTIEQSTASAIEQFKAKGGDMLPINALARHIEDTGSEQMLMAALMAAQSVMGLKELSRIGARLTKR